MVHQYNVVWLKLIIEVDDGNLKIQVRAQAPPVTCRWKKMGGGGGSKTYIQRCPLIGQPPASKALARLGRKAARKHTRKVAHVFRVVAPSPSPLPRPAALPAGVSYTRLTASHQAVEPDERVRILSGSSRGARRQRRVFVSEIILRRRGGVVAVDGDGPPAPGRPADRLRCHRHVRPEVCFV